MKELLVKKLAPDAKLPERKTPYSAGLDIYANEDTVIKPMERKIIKTGIAVEIPQTYEGQVRGRSGLFVKEGLLVPIGTIDSDYRGELGVMCINLTNEDMVILKHTRVAQLIINKISNFEPIEVKELSSTERGTGGFGSTGKK